MWNTEDITVESVVSKLLEYKDTYISKCIGDLRKVGSNYSLRR